MAFNVPSLSVWNFGITFFIALSSCTIAFAAEGPKTPEEFAAQYMAAFNKKDVAALNALKYPVTVKSTLQDMIDQMTAAEMSGGTHFDKFEILPVQPGIDKPMMGPDGNFYRSNLPPTNMVKLSAQ